MITRNKFNLTVVYIRVTRLRSRLDLGIIKV